MNNPKVADIAKQLEIKTPMGYSEDGNYPEKNLPDDIALIIPPPKKPKKGGLGSALNDMLQGDD